MRWKIRRADRFQIPDSKTVERLAKELCDTRYLSLDPPMKDAYAKLTKPTRDRYVAQAVMLIERGWRGGSP